MKVIFFINDLGSGGAEHQLVQLANGLVDRNYEVSIATFGDEEDHYSYSKRINRIHIAPHKNKYIKMLAIWKLFLTIKTDWIISFCQRQNLMCLTALIFRSKKSVRVIAGERNATIGKADWRERVLMNWLYKRANYIVPNSFTQRNHIIKKKPQYENKTTTIINFTDLQSYSFSQLPNETVLRIGVFSRYSNQKNCLRFVDAIKKVKESTGRLFVVEWFGSIYHKNGKPEPMFLQMKNRIREYNLQDYIRLNDHIKDVPETMRAFSAICSPSLFEGFSNSIGEAICCGKPMLVSDVSDNSIMVNDGVNGFLFDPINVDSICVAFLKFFSLSYEDMRNMSCASRKIAESLFDYNHFIDSYVALLES